MDLEAARELALNQLTYCDRTRAELERHLAKHEVPPELSEELLGRLESAGLIDDERFAKAWVVSRHHTKGLSRRALHEELRRKGVSDALIQGALDAIDSDGEWAAAHELASNRLAKLPADLPEQTKLRRLVGMLARKGYSPELSYEVAKQATGE
jgi:regulatory protein